MIRVYYLPVIVQDNTECVAGTEFIHDALLDCQEDPVIRRLTQDTTQEEHEGLIAIALHWREATAGEQTLYQEYVTILVPHPDTLRAQELLSSSPDAITMPHIWELLRIFGKRLGYRFD